MKRRAFVQAMGTAVASGFVAPLRAVRTGSHGTAKLERIGLELYAVRKAMRLDPERTLAAVRAMGYDDVELLWSFDNFGRTPQQVRGTLEHEGLKAPSCHMAPEVILKDWDRSLEKAHLLGHQYLIVPSLPDETQHSLDAWKQWADRFNAAGAAARRAGIWLAFHNEPDHMTPIDGAVPYDVFIGRLDSSAVRLQLDVGNMLMGHGDPMRYLQAHRDWYWSFHLKDVVADGSRDTELGTGTFDFAHFLTAIPELSRKPCYVEQENPTDELASARVNYAYLRRLSFA